MKDKWTSWFVGPVKVEKKVGPVLYQIRKSPRSQAQLVYVDKLKPCFGDLPKAWGGEEPEIVIPLLEFPEEVEETLNPRPRRQIKAPEGFMGSMMNKIYLVRYKNVYPFIVFLNVRLTCLSFICIALQGHAYMMLFYCMMHNRTVRLLMQRLLYTLCII